MDDLRVHLENLLRDAAECRLISDLTTDAVKRELLRVSPTTTTSGPANSSAHATSSSPASHPPSSQHPGANYLRLRSGLAARQSLYQIVDHRVQLAWHEIERCQRDRKPKAPRPSASGIQIQHAVDRIDPDLMRMA